MLRRPNDRAAAELALVGVTLIWGGTFVIVKNALPQVSVLLFLALRFSLAALALMLFFRGRLTPPEGPRRAALVGGAWAGLCLFLAYFTQTLGLRYTTPSKSAFLTGLTVPMVPFLSSIVYQRAPHVSEAGGVALATFGMALLTLPQAGFSIGFGDALTLCCALLFACHILVLGKWAPRASLEVLSLSQIAVTALLALLSCGWAEQPFVRWTPAVIAAIVVTGLLATAVAFTVQAWAQRHTSATRAALIFALEPVAASLTSYLVDRELLSGRGMVGAILILAGVLMVELKPIGSRPHPSQ